MTIVWFKYSGSSILKQPIVREWELQKKKPELFIVSEWVTLLV